MIKKVLIRLSKYFTTAILSIGIIGICIQPATAQSSDSSQNNLKQLRSDVGINGITANFHALSDLNYLGNDTLQYDGSSELEIVLRDVRMMMPQLGVGFQIVTSFFVDNSGNNSNFGIGSWGAGPVVRYYPFRTNRVQPYVQANSLFGKDLAVSTLANTESGGDGFRVRLGLRGGLAIRLNNTIGLFTEVGYDWESSRIFKADARALQANIGFDLYLFN